MSMYEMITKKKPVIFKYLQKYIYYKVQKKNIEFPIKLSKLLAQREKTNLN